MSGAAVLTACLCLLQLQLLCTSGAASAVEALLLPADVFTVSPGPPVRHSWSPSQHPMDSMAVQHIRLIDLEVTSLPTSTVRRSFLASPVASPFTPLLCLRCDGASPAPTTRCASPTWVLSVQRHPIAASVDASDVSMLIFSGLILLPLLSSPLCSCRTRPPCGWWSLSQPRRCPPLVVVCWTWRSC